MSEMFDAEEMMGKLYADDEEVCPECAELIDDCVCDDELNDLEDEDEDESR
jgi:hypothetical protein